MGSLTVDRPSTECSQDALPLATSDSSRWPLRRQLGMITIAWMFGAIWFNVTTGAPLTLFARALGASKMQFGILAALPYVAALFSVPGSLLAERTGARKRIFLDAFYVQRCLWFVIAVAPLVMLHWYGPAAGPRAVALVLALVFVMYASGAMGGPAWVSWMADVVPQQIRGTYFARRRQWGIVTAVPAALLVGVGLDRLAGGDHLPWLSGVPPIVFWCAVLFFVTAFFGLADIGCFHHMPHTPKPSHRGSDLLQSLWAPVRDKPFMALSTFVGAINFTVGFTNQFATLYVIDRLKVDNMQAQLMLLVMPMALQLLLLPAWGAAADRVGRKPLLIIAAIGLVPTGFGWCLMGSDMPGLGYVLYACGTALWTGIEVANFNAVIDLSGGQAKDGKKHPGGSGYHAVNTVIINVAGCTGGLVAGLIAQQLADWHWQPIAGMRTFDFYDALFTLSGVVRVGALIVLAPLMAEPTAKSAMQALRFMVAYTAERMTVKVSAGIRAVAGVRPIVPVEPEPAGPTAST